MDATRPSLLFRLKEGDDPVAWEDFFRQYSGVILRYGAKLRLNEQQSHDILQETMIELIRVLPRFEYDTHRGKFRNFLLTIVHRKILKSINRRQRRGEVSLETSAEDGVPYSVLLGTEEKDLVGEKDELRWHRSILEDCLEQLRQDPDIKAHTLDIFIAFAIEGKSAREVGAAFGSTENNVYQIKNRIMARLKTDVAERLEELA